MHVSGVKSTLYNACPAASCATAAIMCQRRAHAGAGLGDMIAKYVSICEWQLATSSSARSTARDRRPHARVGEEDRRQRALSRGRDP
jgi:glycerol dehydrogenase-like iron-containing ADH family enzyme